MLQQGKNLTEELLERGLLHDCIPGTEELLQSETVKGYVGFDPTASSLHIGNLVPVILLRHLQRAGHIPVVLVGGATGMIGDPSGKSAERNLLDESQLQHNVNAIRTQLEKLIDFTGPHAAVLVNNYDWIKSFSFLDFLREAGKHISVNYMMAKDSVKNRLETGISFTEFSYQLIQGYDFYHLWKNFGVKLQMGGSDQWGNITTGTEFIRRKAQGDAFALVAPLLTKPDGSKFGKSEQGNVWLDPKLTSPYKFFQFWMNITDEESLKLIKVFSFRPLEELKELIKKHTEAPHERVLQKTLAEDVTSWIHGVVEYEKAADASEILFGRGTAEQLVAFDEERIRSVFEGVPTFTVAKEKVESGLSMLSLTAEETTIFSSKGEAKRMFQNNGVLLNKSNASEDYQVTDKDLLAGKFLLVGKGKRNFNLVVVE
jgi:tyrosyl-tRNA synthetase